MDTNCPQCGSPGKPTSTDGVWACERMHTYRPPVPTPAPRAPPSPSPKGTRQYLVVTQRDEFFKSKFNPEALQELLNSHAAQGWRVVSMTATDVGSFLGSFWGKGGGSARQELVVLLERTVE